MLLSAGADPNARNLAGRTPLAAAAGEGQIGAVRELLRPRARLPQADVNAAAQNERTPLHLAAVRGSAQSVKLLLKAGARVRPGPFLVGVGAALALLRGYRWQG
jgi:ankyrin repeat protein